MSTRAKLIAARVSMLALADQLQNISRACKTAGISRSHFYEIKAAFEQYGREGSHPRLVGGPGCRTRPRRSASASTGRSRRNSSAWPIGRPCTSRCSSYRTIWTTSCASTTRSGATRVSHPRADPVADVPGWAHGDRATLGSVRESSASEPPALSGDLQRCTCDKVDFAVSTRGISFLLQRAGLVRPWIADRHISPRWRHPTRSSSLRYYRPFCTIAVDLDQLVYGPVWSAPMRLRQGLSAGRQERRCWTRSLESFL